MVVLTTENGHVVRVLVDIRSRSYPTVFASQDMLLELAGASHSTKEYTAVSLTKTVGNTFKIRNKF